MPFRTMQLAAAFLILASMEVAQVSSAGPPPANAIDLFVGMESGEIEAKIIPKDATKGTILIENKSNKPVTIKLPEAFAAVPVLAQFGCPGGGGGCPGGGGNQGMGGGMMGGGGGMMGGGGMFNIGPERVVKVKVVTVCLEHGKKDPSPHVAYQLVKLDSFAKAPAACEIVKMLARGEIDQHSAQAAVWHLENGLSWEELASKVGVRHLNGTIDPYFSVSHLQQAFAATKAAVTRARQLSATPTFAQATDEK